MKILIGQTELEVLDCYTFRFKNGRLVLNLKLLQEVVEISVLRTLIDKNKEDIICTHNDGTKKLFSGFSYSASYTITNEENEDGTTTPVYKVEVECTSEQEFQNGLLKQKIAELNQSIAQQNEVINTQSQVINNQAMSITLMEDVMLEQLMAEDIVGMDDTEESIVAEESEVA